MTRKIHPFRGTVITRLAVTLAGMAGLLFFLCLGLAGCDLDKDEGILMAAGSYGDIAVVLSHDSLRGAVQPFLDRLNTPVTFVIKEENPYNIDIFGPRKWDLCKGYRNILFMVRWGDGGPVEKKCQSLLSDDSLLRLQQGAGGLAQFNDPFARYQFGLMVGAHDAGSLASVLNRNRDRIADLLEDKCSERIQRRFRHTGLQEKAMAHHWDHHRFFLELPLQYVQKPHRTSRVTGYEWESNESARAITLAWRDSDVPAADLLDRELLLRWRRQIGESLQEVEIPDVILEWHEEELAGLPGLKLTGSWSSSVVQGGGPFRSYFLADTAGERLFCLDLRCFAPGREKMPSFREMQAVVETFSLNRPQP
jgi:hypothetical protein